MKKIIPLLILLAMPVFTLAKEQPIQQLKAFISASKTLTADFKQISFDENGSPTQTSNGKFYLQRPGKFRWDYQKPFIQEIVSNAGKVWFFDADLEQVTIKKLDKSLGSTPALLLTGEVSLEENFTLEKQGTDADMVWIKLLPKNLESGFNYILIGLEKGRLGGMELSDSFGQLTRIYFSDVKTNIDIDPAIFEFIVPEGADVFEE
jgi:outer membrane lipoprotein carrier protein